MATRPWSVLAGLAFIVTGCVETTADAPDAGSPGSICDPFREPPPPLTLRKVLAAGQTKDGTLYLVDCDSLSAGWMGAPRVFRSTGSALERARITNTLGNSPDLFIADFTDGLIRIEVKGAATRMAFFAGVHLANDNKTKEPAIDAEHELTLVSAEAYSALPLASYMTEVKVLYDARADDGNRFVALYRDDVPASKPRVFYGPGDRLTERRVANVAGGNTREVYFDLDGVRVVAYLYFGGDHGTYPSQIREVGDTGATSRNVLTRTIGGQAGLTCVCF